MKTIARATAKPGPAVLGGERGRGRARSPEPAAPASTFADTLLQMQATLGNRAVARRAEATLGRSAQARDSDALAVEPEQDLEAVELDDPPSRSAVPLADNASGGEPPAGSSCSGGGCGCSECSRASSGEPLGTQGKQNAERSTPSGARANEVPERAAPSASASSSSAAEAASIPGPTAESAAPPPSAAAVSTPATASAAAVAPAASAHASSAATEGAAPAARSRPQEQAANSSEAPEQALGTLRSETHGARSTQPEESAASARTAQATRALLLEDSAHPGLGQMARSEFLAQLRVSVQTAAEEGLAGSGRSARECPYIAFWLDYYSSQGAGYLERSARRYAPETAGARSAEELIFLLGERVRRAARIWARTGRVTGVPPGVPTRLPAAGGEAPQAVQRKAGAGHAAAPPSQPHDPAAIQARLGAGRPLDGHVRGRMESAFGQSFSGVHVHDDADAARLSSSLGARAFTVGSDVSFSAGQYRPGTPTGDAILAHELAHVLQQREARPTSAWIAPESAHGPHEQDADRAAGGAVASLWGRSRPGLSRLGAAMPRLRSGLRLQRCKSDTPAPTQATAAAGAGPCGATSLAASYVPTEAGISEADAAPTSGFGNTTRLHAATTFGACQADGQWSFKLNSLAVAIRSGVQPVGFRTEVSSADDPVVTAATYAPIEADLQPTRDFPTTHSCGGTNFSETPHTYSRRRTYWKRDLVVQHEAYHRTDWNSRYRPKLVMAEQAVWAHRVPVASAATESDALSQARPTFNTFFETAYQGACADYAPLQETRAYDNGAPAYQALVDGVQARATREGWTAPPRPPGPGPAPVPAPGAAPAPGP